MNLEIILRSPTESGKIIPKGTIVEYLGHVIGGMIKVRCGQNEEVIHPKTTKQLGK